MFQRALLSQLLEALSDTPVVFLHGARQTGKTTLARATIDAGHRARYLTLDDLRLREAAALDPQAFINGLEGPVILDEVQLVPDLFRAVKLSVDQDRRPGRFLLTGSAHLLVLPELSDALVGRMETLRLAPLCEAEIEGYSAMAVDHLFADTPLPTGPVGGASPEDLATRLARGGFPEVVQRSSAQRRQAWFESYLTTVIQRDVRELANIEGLTALPDLLRLLAARSSQLLNAAEIGRASRLPRTTLNRYLSLLEGTFLVQRLPAWSANLSKRMVRSPKLMLPDSGLLCHLLGLDADLLTNKPKQLGPVLEGFVVQELQKQASWSRIRPRFYHYRNHDGQEVDAVLEDAAGRVVGVEVKAGTNVGARDFRGLLEIESTYDKFHRGILFYGGELALPFGPRMHALPVAWLWQKPSGPTLPHERLDDQRATAEDEKDRPGVDQE